MSDFLKTIQGDLVQAARQSFGQDWSAASLQPSLIEMRQSYAAVTGPDFSRPEIRLAYALASHPYHAFMSYELLSQCAHVLKQQKPGEFSATILGAGPGAEAIALIRFLSESMPDLRRISLTLVDKEPGWENTRRVTLNHTAQQWWSGELHLNHVTADLSLDDDRERVLKTLDGADLVIAQALLTEIVVGEESVNLLADLVNNFSADSLLLLCDFTRMKGFHEWVTELDQLASLRTVIALQNRFPTPTCHDEVKPLFENQNFLRERGQVTVTARLFSRPGWTPPVIEVSDDLIPTEAQKTALDSFARFVRDDTADTFILEGPAGTGKTEIMRRMAAIATTEGHTVSLWAPTGQAAMRLSMRTKLPASTIHSGLFERTGRLDNDTAERDWPPTIVFSRRPLDYSKHIVFVDEASMVGDSVESDDGEPPELKFEDGRLLEQILKGVVAQNGKVVFVGDSCQIAPINEDFSAALDAECLRSRGCHVIEAHLTEVRRTSSDSEILELSTDLRQHVMTGNYTIPSFVPSGDRDVVATVSYGLTPFLVNQFRDGSAVALAARNIDVSLANGLVRHSLGRASALPEADDRLVLVKGNQILGLLNGTDLESRRLVNSQVEVRYRNRITKDFETVQLHDVQLTMKLPSGDALDFTATLVLDSLSSASRDLQSRVRRVLWVDFVIRMRALGLGKHDEDFWKAYESDYRANALLCSYSYARTLHRAQGGEWKSVYLDIHSILPERSGTSRLLYSGVTRAKEALYLRGWPLGPKESMTHERLGEVSVSLLQKALNRKLTYSSIKNLATAVQVSVEDGSTELLVNVFDGKKGINFTPQRGTPEEVQAVNKALEAWSKLEFVRNRHEVPPKLEKGVTRLEAIVNAAGADLFVVQPGRASREVEMFAFVADEFCSFRTWWTDDGGLDLSRLQVTGSNSPSLSDLVASGINQAFS